ASFREKLPNLRYCSQAGGHMARAVKEKLREALPSHTELYVMYGATEASARLSYLEPEFYLDKMDSIGKPISSVTLYILGPDGNHLPPGQSGELVASGPNIMLGYWKDPEATAKALDKTLYHTGDQAYMDSDGFFYVTGRRDDILKVGGHRINTREIEDVLMESDYLMETIVFGIPDDLLGHRLTALAVFKNNNCTENELLGYCARRLPKHKLPTEIRVTRALPKNASGKVDRSKCFDLLYSGALA
ncbi:MAG: class I adenylate-forming enzyme family protein, partial [Anaerolineaceae bacterium]